MPSGGATTPFIRPGLPAQHRGSDAALCDVVSPAAERDSASWPAPGAGTALVGSHEEGAEPILEYHQLGIDQIILSGYPHLEEAFWFGEGVSPILARTKLWQHPGGDRGGR